MADSLDARHGTSDEYHDPYCDLCFDVKGRNHKAWGYCKECFQFLCSACNDVHGNLQASKRHTMFRGEDMPQSQSAKPPRFDDCESHPKHVNDQFCFEHQILLCSACFSSNHKNCTVMSIDNACKYVQTSDVDSLYDTIKDVETNLGKVLSAVDTNAKALEEEKEKILKAADMLHQTIISQANELLQELKDDINLKYKSCLSDLRRLNQQTEETISRIKAALNDIAKEKDKSIETKVFLRLQDALNCKEQCKTEMHHLKRTFRIVSLSLEPNEELQEFLSSTYAMGAISTSEFTSDIALSFPDISFPALPQQPSAAKSLPSQLQPIKQTYHEKPRKLGTYKVKLDNDTEGSLISGIAVTKDGRKLIVDTDNKKVKLFSQDMKPLSSLTLPATPCVVTMISDQEAAVSLRNQQITLIQIIYGQIFIIQTIPVPFYPCGVTKYKDKLVVAASGENPPSVKLIDFTGKVYWSATTDKQGQNMFGGLWYVSSFDDQRISSVIVTDGSENTLTLLDGTTGDIITRRQLEGKEPCGITTDTNGNIYVCYSGSAQVAALSRDLVKERILLSRQDLSGLPYAIAYDNKANQLIISYYNIGYQVDIYQF